MAVDILKEKDENNDYNMEEESDEKEVDHNG